MREARTQTQGHGAAGSYPGCSGVGGSALDADDPDECEHGRLARVEALGGGAWEHAGPGNMNIEAAALATHIMPALNPRMAGKERQSAALQASNEVALTGRRGWQLRTISQGGCGLLMRRKPMDLEAKAAARGHGVRIWLGRREILSA